MPLSHWCAPHQEVPGEAGQELGTPPRVETVPEAALWRGDYVSLISPPPRLAEPSLWKPPALQAACVVWRGSLQTALYFALEWA